MGLPVTQTDKNGVTTTTTYNGYGSPLTVTKGIFIQEYDYSANNMLRQVAIFADENTGVGYQYDALGRVTRETSYAESQGFILKNYTYDADGNRKSFTLMQNGTAQQNVTYAYDILNRPTSVNFGTSGVGGVSYTYDQNGRLLSESGGQNTATYTYNKAGLVTSLTNSNGADYTYAYTLDGNQSQKTDSANGTTNYTYDAIGQLKEETTVKDGETTLTTYAYDSRGNRVGMNQGGIISQYTYDTTNRLVEKVQGVGEETQTKTTYTYDQNGNLTFRMAETLGSVARDEALGIYASQTKEGSQSMQHAMMTKFTYDDFGQLISLETENDRAEYTYDAIGRRNSKTVNGTYRAQIWDVDNIIAEMDENKTITHQYLRANKLIAQKIGDEIGYYTYDAHGSVTGMDGEAYNYDAFGNLQGDIFKDNPFLYCGEYYDAESGFVYLRNRYYDPTLGRFTTEDPIHDGLNWYVYCGNNPVMFVDPSGLDSYIYYMSEREAEALVHQQALLDADPDNPVHFIEVDSLKTFYKNWNNMGVVDGKEVSIDTVIINMHGDNEGIYHEGDKNKNIDLKKLDRKEIGTLVLLSCNTGLTDSKTENFATQFLKDQDANVVLAPDGYCVNDEDTPGRFCSALKIDTNYNGTTDLCLAQDQSRIGNGFCAYFQVGDEIAYLPKISRNNQWLDSVSTLIFKGQEAAKIKRTIHNMRKYESDFITKDDLDDLESRLLGLLLN